MSYTPQDEARRALERRIRAATDAANRAWDAWRDRPHDCTPEAECAYEDAMVASNTHLDHLYRKLRKVELGWYHLTVDEQEEAQR